MKRAAAAALILVVLGALWLSASSTLHLGVLHGVPGVAQPALVVVLEIASVIGTALWVTAPAGRKIKPAAVVLLASGVAAVGGWQAYGWLGLVAPFAVVLVTDMVAEHWSSMPVHRYTVDGAAEVEVAPGGEGTRPEANEPDDEILRWLASEEVKLGRPVGRDPVKRHFSIGTRRADRLVREHRSRPRLAPVAALPDMTNEVNAR